MNQTICPDCKGLGDDNVKYEFNKCERCNGIGKVIEELETETQQEQ